MKVSGGRTLSVGKSLRGGMATFGGTNLPESNEISNGRCSTFGTCGAAAGGATVDP